MKYYALFLDTNKYVEKCLALIKYICNPYSKSTPHVTTRVFKEESLGTKLIEEAEISYLNLIDIDSFNIEELTPPYIIYIRCESKDLEAQEYKPDFPYSRLHITLYSGNDLIFAKSLYSELKKITWKIKLDFHPAKKLTKKNVGESLIDDSFNEKINAIAFEILGKNIDFQSLKSDDKISLIKEIINNIDYYKNNSTLQTINSNYNFDQKINNRIIDASSQNDIDIKESAFITPPEYAKEMAELALNYSNDFKCFDFGDSSIGTGSLYMAYLNTVSKLEQNKKLHSAIGIDINEKMTEEARTRFGARGLEVILGDALLMNNKTLKSKRNIMIVNPPYNRNHIIPKKYRDTICELAEQYTGISVSKESSLYVYHLLIMDRWLTTNGIAVWLIPSVFLQTKYGFAVRKYLTENVTLLKIHIYDDQMIQFDNANISTTVVVFKKKKPLKTSFVEVSHGMSAIASNHKCISTKTLVKNMDNWRRIIVSDTKTNIPNQFKINDLFDIKRGIATGANSFFVVDEQKVKEIGIPHIALKPILPKSRYLKTTIIETNQDGTPIVEPRLFLIDCDLPESIIKDKYPSFYKYLESAKKDEDNKCIIERTLVRSRKPWYKQEQRLPPKYLMTYMGRNKKSLPPLYFLLNKSKAVALNTYLLLYPKQWLQKLIDNNSGLDEQLLECLNNSAKINISKETIVYSGSLQKLEPNQLRELSVLDLPDSIKRAMKNEEYKQLLSQ